MTGRPPAGRTEFLATDETRMRTGAVRGAGGRGRFSGRTAVFLNSEPRIRKPQSAVRIWLLLASEPRATVETYLVAYDISDPRWLPKAARACEDFGPWSQYSVVLCRLNAARPAPCRRRSAAGRGPKPMSDRVGRDPLRTDTGYRSRSRSSRQ
jgi:CRISPR associated protein Cas2